MMETYRLKSILDINLRYNQIKFIMEGAAMMKQEPQANDVQTRYSEIAVITHLEDLIKKKIDDMAVKIMYQAELMERNKMKLNSDIVANIPSMEDRLSAMLTDKLSSSVAEMSAIQAHNNNQSNGPYQRQNYQQRPKTNFQQRNYQRPQALSFLNTLIQRDFKNLEEHYTDYFQILTDQTQDANILQNYIIDLKSAIINLVEGKLSPLLLKPKVIQQTVLDIQNILNANYTGYKVLTSNPHYYYNYAKYVVLQNNTKLYLAVQFPLTTHGKLFEVYKIKSVPVQVTTNTSHATQLFDVPRYMLITHDRKFFTTLTFEQMNMCQDIDMLKDVTTFSPAQLWYKLCNNHTDIDYLEATNYLADINFDPFNYSSLQTDCLEILFKNEELDIPYNDLPPL
ncbi:unnamed protein product [Mytilus edulis]|uniref:Uncharacterized protein n=1 Tax=Mytilus edulis TaxID=6550 RepID=A0A8S3U6V9_MYTED|nr:unnamed protein product [Mytilus edulis]